jgi:TRAP-type C4-dicarboxylate transport system substrate-binding protein
LEEAGVVFNEVEAQAFVDATKPVYDKWRETYPELVDEMVAAAAAAKK